MWKIFILVFLFLVLGALLGYKYIPKSENLSPSPQVIQSVISVSDQKPGSSVLVGRVSMIKAGYVVIYENNNGKPGNIIGNSKILPEGESTNISVTLTKVTADGESLFAVLHGDNGDNAFYPNIDVPLRDQDNNIMYTLFYVSQNASR